MNTFKIGTHKQLCYLQGNQNRNNSLCQIADKRQQGRHLSVAAQGICKPCVLASVFSYILML